MQAAKGKAAGVFDAPATAQESTTNPIIGAAPIDDKTVANLRAQFALKGHCMTVSRNRDGRVVYAVSRWGQSRFFSHQHDVIAFLRQISGGAA